MATQTEPKQFKIVCGLPNKLEEQLSDLMNQGWRLRGRTYTGKILNNSIIANPTTQIFIKCQNLVKN